MQLVNKLLVEYTLALQTNTKKIVLFSPHTYLPALHVKAFSSFHNRIKKSSLEEFIKN